MRGIDAARHVALDEADRAREPIHAGAVVETVGPPERREAIAARVRGTAQARAEPVRLVTDGAHAAEDFGAAMRSLAGLRAPVDAFFDKVLVNSDDVAERDNRLRLLVQVRDAMGQVADFSLVAG